MEIPFRKYHALGNDYLVLDPAQVPAPPSAAQIRLVCRRHQGIGADGVLWGPLPSQRATFALRIYNPDGSEAEKSGNGLRIFSRYLWDTRRVDERPFDVETLGGVVRAVVQENGRRVQVEMGRASFWSQDIPVAGEPREVLQEEIVAGERSFCFCAATIGNPHCVILVEDPTPALACQFGPLLEVHPWFPNRSNVQFVRVLDRSNVRLEIWERGAGYTLASGSSSCAAAAVAHRLGLCDARLVVHMPGGTLDIAIDEGGQIVMAGPVTRVGAGTACDEIFELDMP